MAGIVDAITSALAAVARSRSIAVRMRILRTVRTALQAWRAGDLTEDETVQTIERILEEAKRG